MRAQEEVTCCPQELWFKLPLPPHSAPGHPPTACRVGKRGVRGAEGGVSSASSPGHTRDFSVVGAFNSVTDV